MASEAKIVELLTREFGVDPARIAHEARLAVETFGDAVALVERHLAAKGG